VLLLECVPLRRLCEFGGERDRLLGQRLNGLQSIQPRDGGMAVTGDEIHLLVRRLCPGGPARFIREAEVGERHAAGSIAWPEGVIRPAAEAEHAPVMEQLRHEQAVPFRKVGRWPCLWTCSARPACRRLRLARGQWGRRHTLERTDYGTPAKVPFHKSRGFVVGSASGRRCQSAQSGIKAE